MSTTEPRPNNRRLALFPLPFQGHINPMLQLANILHAKCFKITIIHTDFNSPNQSNYPQFTFKSISDGLSGSKDMNLNLDTTNSVINFLNKSCIEPFTDYLIKLQEDDQKTIACLITDALWSCILVYAALPLLIEKGYLKTTIEEEPIPVPDLAPIKKKDVLKILNSDFKEGKLELISSMIKNTKAASGIIWNTFKELEEPASSAISQDFGAPCFLIGPFHKYFPTSTSSLLEHDRSFMPWLDLQPIRSVVYVSFGSIAQMGEAEFTDMAWEVANSKQRFLWVVRAGSVSGSDWLESLPEGFVEEVDERGFIVKWAPQQEVLAHWAIGVFWTHNGWN